MFNLNNIHSRRFATHFFLICDFSEQPLKAFPAWLLSPNELMVDLPGDPSVTMAEMEASILDFLIFIFEIVASSADF